MKIFICFSTLMFFVSCLSQQNKYVIENKPKLHFKEAYYQDWTSGIKGGGSGVSIYLTKEESSNNISIEGIYFNNKYSKLKYQGNNKYQGFVKNKENLETNQLDDKPIKKEATTPEIKIPFTLSKNEAVISFKINKKQKFMKIILAKNEASGLPM